MTLQPDGNGEPRDKGDSVGLLKGDLDEEKRGVIQEE